MSRVRSQSVIFPWGERIRLSGKVVCFQPYGRRRAVRVSHQRDVDVLSGRDGFFFVSDTTAPVFSLADGVRDVVEFFVDPQDSLSWFLSRFSSFLDCNPSLGFSPANFTVSGNKLVLFIGKYSSAAPYLKSVIAALQLHDFSFLPAVMVSSPSLSNEDLSKFWGVLRGSLMSFIESEGYIPLPVITCLSSRPGLKLFRDVRARFPGVRFDSDQDTKIWVDVESGADYIKPDYRWFNLPLEVLECVDESGLKVVFPSGAIARSIWVDGSSDMDLGCREWWRNAASGPSFASTDVERFTFDEIYDELAAVDDVGEGLWRSFLESKFSGVEASAWVWAAAVQLLYDRFCDGRLSRSGAQHFVSYVESVGFDQENLVVREVVSGLSEEFLSFLVELDAFTVFRQVCEASEFGSVKISPSALQSGSWFNFVSSKNDYFLFSLNLEALRVFQERILDAKVDDVLHVTSGFLSSVYCLLFFFLSFYDRDAADSAADELSSGRFTLEGLSDVKMSDLLSVLRSVAV